MANLNIEEVEHQGSWAQLRLDGEIDLETVSLLKKSLEDLQAREVTCLALDFTETRYCNSSALAVLVRFAEQFREAGGGISLVNVSQRVRMPFEMLGLLVFFKFCDSIEAARAAFPAQAAG